MLILSPKTIDIASGKELEFQMKEVFFNITPKELTPAERFKIRLEISRGNSTISGGVTQAENKHGDRFIRFFREHVPATGRDLLEIFNEYSRGNPSKYFLDFMEEAVRIPAFYKALFPKECKLDESARKDRINDAGAAAFPNQHAPVDQHLAVYFGEGKPYTAVLQTICRHCPMEDCMHFVRAHTTITLVTVPASK